MEVHLESAVWMFLLLMFNALVESTQLLTVEMNPPFQLSVQLVELLLPDVCQAQVC